MANYLYNGKELPALPEWDREAYPYAIVGWNSNITQYVCYVAGRITWYGNGVGFDNNYVWYYVVDNAWQEQGSNDSGFNPYVTPIWSNFDIIDDDGTLYLAASEPVPVVPTPPSEQTAFCIGKTFGRLIRNAISAQSS